VRLAADAVARLRARQRRGLLEPAQARAEALSELLLAPERRLDRFADRAADLGVPVAGWHVVARLAAAHEPGTAADVARERDVALSEAAVDAIAAVGAPWHPARVEATLVLVRPWPAEPSQAAVAAASREAGTLLERLRGAAAGTALHCGIAGPRQGAAGLRTCATEALTALGAARSLQRPHVPVNIDDVTLPRTLLEWLSSDAGQVATRRVLEPLDALGPARSLAAVRTLHAYLDERGSLARCAERLHLHRNAVAYRMRQIRERLETDLDDPDQRLTLQLACRARLLAVAGEDG
jgi:sugar diacid utilization regulator